MEFKKKSIEDLKNQIVEENLKKQIHKSNTPIEKVLKNKENKIKDLQSRISFFEYSLNKDKIFTSKKIDTYLKEIKEKSQKIQQLTSQLEKMSELKQNYEQMENEILSLNKQMVQNQNMIKENELNYLAEKNMYLEGLKSKSEEISNLREKLLLLERIVQDRKTNCFDVQIQVGNTDLKKSCLIGSEKELKYTLYEYMIGKQPIVSF